MKKALILLFLTVVSIMSAQEKKATLLVSEVNGNVRYHEGNTRTVLEEGKGLCEEDVLTIPANATVTILEPRAGKMYSMKGTYSGSIGKYIQRNEQTCVTNVTKQYMRYLLTRVFSSKKVYAGAREDGAATVYRDVDSIFATPDAVLTAKKDSVTTQK